MTAIRPRDGSAQRRKWFGRLGQSLIASTLAVLCVAAPRAAKADLIEKYNLNMTAVTSGFNNGSNDPVITVVGQFLFDSTLGYVTSVNLNVSTSSATSLNLPTGGITIDTAQTSNEDAKDLFAQSANGSYAISFEFASPLSLLGTLDNVLNQPYTDGGNAKFFDANASGDTSYHIGYFGVTGGAVPEPSSILLLGVSLLGLAFIRRRAFGGAS